VPDLEGALSVARPGRIICNQVLHHLEERAIERAVLPWCKQNDVVVVAYSPFGHGHFPGPRTPGGRILKQIADTHNATPRQVALRFLVRRPSVFAIPKASNAQHAEENARAGSLQLKDEQLARIDAAFPVKPGRGLPMLWARWRDDGPEWFDCAC
jgi:diketogulonate reductase-like aldo/keto reductase